MLWKFSRNSFLWELQSDRRSCWNVFSASRLQESPEIFLLPAVTTVPVSWLCWTCLHTAQASRWFPRFEPKLPINRTLPISNTSPHVFTVKPGPESQPCLTFQCLFDLCCYLVLSCYWEKGLWFPVMAAQQEEMSSSTTKSLFSYMFLGTEKGREKEKQINFRV